MATDAVATTQDKPKVTVTQLRLAQHFARQSESLFQRYVREFAEQEGVSPQTVMSFLCRPEGAE